MRPADSQTNLRAGIFIPHIQPFYDIKLSTLPPSYPNTRWELVPVGEHFGIRSFFGTPPPTLAMTVSGNDAPGAAVGASSWSGAQNQLWTAKNVVGKLWVFLTASGGHCLQAVGGLGTSLVLAAYDPSGHGAGQTWVFPND
jgi:hypothetical protein